ncbi:CesT family type III secretion system chaperone [Brenneria izbisi]|uniref:CesT family type III secretion system chaperone n=1 Tax=Brenneria izbisi TaxID=2939450 RepID=A0AA42C1J3_9GAMM|nr:CesT family type III secretion system chaperone [Brenneria izbisi]MCV9877493.1 CesT family type III secretion system chaperone [Brenneria izbisi]MCV9880941.1 CesT family type III secretion system chaperone [Brenneria izbisi]
MRNDIIKDLLDYYRVDRSTLSPQDGEVYAIKIGGSDEVALFQDKDDWLHLVINLGVSTLAPDKLYRDIAYFNDINVKQPLLVLGVNRNDEQVTLHSRFPVQQLNKVRLVEYFENFVDTSARLKGHFNLQSGVSNG